MLTKLNANEELLASIRSIQEKEVGLKAWHCPLPDAQQHFAVPGGIECSGDSGIGFWPCSYHHWTILAYSFLPWRVELCTNLFPSSFSATTYFFVIFLFPYGGFSLRGIAWDWVFAQVHAASFFLNTSCLSDIRSSALLNKPERRWQLSLLICLKVWKLKVWKFHSFSLVFPVSHHAFHSHYVFLSTLGG